jgi:hypothetical protein
MELRLPSDSTASQVFAKLQAGNPINQINLLEKYQLRSI